MNIHECLEKYMNEFLSSFIMSGPKSEGVTKIKVRPVMIKDELLFQATEYVGTKVLHKNYDMLMPALSYGIIKERMSALLTDALRAELLNENGYKTDILEFIDMEHTPNNLLIRGIKTGKAKANPQVHKMMEELNISQTLDKLLS